jgi:hypothetical protein
MDNNNITREQLELINHICIIYDDNIRQINRLQESNNIIRDTIIDVIYSTPNIRNPNTTQRQNSASLNHTRLYFLFQRLFDPVDTSLNTIPTQLQIEQATQNVTYGDIISPLNTSCPISLENFNDNSQVTRIRHCGHIFNRAGLNTWFTRNSLCPSCRYDIRNYNTNIDTNTNTNINTSSNTNTSTNSNVNINTNNFNNSIDQDLINLIIDPSNNLYDVSNTLTSMLFRYR